jgi:hypothetical protein
VEARGLCRRHYRRWRRGQLPDVVAPLQRTAKGRYPHCTRPGCGASHYAKGLCQRHYHQARTGRWATAGPRRGEAHPRALLTAEKVHRIRALRAQGWAVQRIGQEFGVSGDTVRSVLSGRTWRHV